MKAEVLRPIVKPESLEEIAGIALEVGRLLMESGGSARGVEEITRQVAAGLGARHISLRVGYASLALTIAKEHDSVTRICRVGALGVNQRLHYLLGAAAAQVERGDFTLKQLQWELDRLVRASRHHPDWVVALAVGLGCAAFGRLLDVDWAGVGPIFIVAVMAQILRRQLAAHSFNVFLSATVVAFVGSSLCGLGARWAASHTVARDMIAPVLLLIPGVPAFNAQFDILEGRPTLASARAVWVAVVLVFMTVGVWLARGLLGEAG